MAAARIQLSSLADGTIFAKQLSGQLIPASGATAFVYQHATTTQVTVFAAETGAGTLGQPLTADVNGLLPGWLAAGQDLDVVATFGGVTGAAAQAEPEIASSVVNSSLTIPWAWSYPTETTEKIHFQLTPPTRAPFEMVSWGSANTDGLTTDHWVGIGFNPRVFIAPATDGVAGQPAMFMGFEDGWYQAGLPHQGAEWYISYFSPDHTTVQLFRPFYTRVAMDSNASHRADTFLDIGTDATGSFNVAAGPFQPIFTVSGAFAGPVVGTLFSGANTTLTIDGANFGPFLTFKFGGAAGFSLNAPAAINFVIQDGAGRGHMTLTKGTSAVLAKSQFGSRLYVDSSLVIGTAVLANAATDGFLYLPTVAGTPTGVPTAQTGAVAAAYDTTANKLWIYNGAWKAATFV